MSNNIYLVGPMAAGKTTVGKLLSRELGWGFVDLDCLVEKGTGHSVTEIFRAEGEGRFRSLEKEALVEAASRSQLVVALGSGTFVDPENRAIAMATGPCVFLDAPLEKILERAREHESRPLSAGIEDLKRIIEFRRASYILADIHVDAGASPERVVEAILEKVGKARG
ncbi:MAG: shikimate kinase [Acidobacteriota bacterium]